MNCEIVGKQPAPQTGNQRQNLAHQEAFFYQTSKNKKQTNQINFRLFLSIQLYDTY